MPTFAIHVSGGVALSETLKATQRRPSFKKSSLENGDDKVCFKISQGLKAHRPWKQQDAGASWRQRLHNAATLWPDHKQLSYHYMRSCCHLLVYSGSAQHAVQTQKSETSKQLLNFPPSCAYDCKLCYYFWVALESPGQYLGHQRILVLGTNADVYSSYIGGGETTKVPKVVDSECFLLVTSELNYDLIEIWFLGSYLRNFNSVCLSKIPGICSFKISADSLGLT